MVGMPTTVIASGIWLWAESAFAGFTLVLTGCLVGLVIWALAYPCDYELHASGLRIRCGLLEEEIAWQRIRSLECTHSFGSAPALSLRRVKIGLDEGCRLVSPADREAFLRACRVHLPVSASVPPAPRAQGPAKRS